MKKLSIFVLLAILTSSCEKVIDYELPREPERIAIDTRIIDGFPVAAYLSTSVYALSLDEPTADNQFRVYLYEDGVLRDSLVPVDTLGPVFYRGDYITSPGHTYKLEAHRQGFETAYGQDQMREPVNVVHSEYDTASAFHRLLVEFEDPPTTGDYYMFSFQNDTTTLPTDRLYFSTIDPTVEVFYSSSSFFDEDATTSGNVGFVSDEFFNGDVKKLDLRFESDPDSSASRDPAETSIRFELLRISRDFYLHERSKALHNEATGNPFSEPVQVYSNVVNGQGIVAAGSVTRVVVEP